MSSNKNQSQLDNNELFNLAIHANQNKQPGQAIEHLKELISREPKLGSAHYLLGATHADIGMYDLAAEEITTALKLDPELNVARFQLGLLHLTSGNIDMAVETWKELQTKDNKDEFYYFCKGLLGLSNDDYQGCIDNLAKGMDLNQTNQPLNDDMQMLLNEAVKAKEGIITEDSTADIESEKSTGHHVLLNAYQNVDQDAEK
jgi:tetratricopeptide (TPR) repeat protein